MALQRRGRISCDRRPPRRSPAPRIGPAQARLIAVLACPLGIALLARMAGWPLGGTALVALAVLCGYLVFAVARRVGGATLVSAGQLAALTPLEFERYVAAWFRARGYRAERCGGRGDGGVDIRLWRGGRAAIVQCKRYGPAQPVGPAVIRELVGTRMLQGAGHAWLATTGRVTAAAHELARSEGITVIDAATLAAPPAGGRVWWRPRWVRVSAVAHAGMRLAEGNGESS